MNVALNPENSSVVRPSTLKLAYGPKWTAPLVSDTEVYVVVPDPPVKIAPFKFAVVFEMPKLPEVFVA